MTEQLTLVAKERFSEGKSFSRTLRRSGTIPAVVYGGKEHSKKIQILEKDIVKAVEIPGFSTQVLKISLSSGDVDVVVKEIQRHPATSKVIHADFMRVDPDSKISLTVPIRTINDDICIGVKVNDGQVNHLINDIEIACLASNLPEYLEVDVQEMDIGDSVLLSEIILPKGVEITILIQDKDRDQAVVSVTEAREIIIEEEVIEEIEEGEPSEDEGEAEEGETDEVQETEGSHKKEKDPSKETKQD